MSSKPVADRERASHEAQTTAAESAAAIAKAIGEQLAPYLAEGQTCPNVALLMNASADLLKQKTDQMVAADATYVAAVEASGAARSERDEAAKALREQLATRCGTVDELYGEGGRWTVLALEGEAPRDPAAVLGQCRTTMEHLAAPDLQMPEPKVTGVAVDPNQWAADMRGPCDRLDETIQTVAAREKEEADAQTAKNEAIAVYDSTYKRVSRLLEALQGFTDEGSARPKAAAALDGLKASVDRLSEAARGSGAPSLSGLLRKRGKEDAAEQ